MPHLNLPHSIAPFLFSVALLGVPRPAAADDGWVSLFDGTSLTGWKAAENPGSFRVVDGTIACDGPRAHLFYTGADGKADFENFELSVEVLTKPGANSGVYFHTAWQETGWPTAKGFEVQVDNSQKEHAGYLEYKMTGSLYGIRNLYKVITPDNEWFTMTVTVRKPRVEIRLNGTLVVDYIEPAEPRPDGANFNRLDHGTFALQCHDAGSKAFYRNLRVRPLTRVTAADIQQPALDAQALQRLSLGHDNFPLVDLHTHLKGGLTLEQALAVSRATGMGLGIATNGGQGFPIQNDAAALAFIEVMKGQPVFIALQAEGREWTRMFSKKTRARFDYIFSDAMTFTNAAGKRLRLWIPGEADIGSDVQAFMEELTATAVRIIATEPIDIYVNPTFLPDALAARYDELWTEERMERIVTAAVKHRVAIEINARYKLPSERFISLAKAAGAKFTFGTNNTSAKDFGDWTYPLEMQRKAGLTWKDMFVPGHQPSRAQRELGP